MTDRTDRELGDRELGMNRSITRRDFLNGVAVTAGAALMPWHLFADGDPEKSSAYYPPALTGMRGSHPGSFDAAHSLRDGTFWDTAGTQQDTGETYDLVIVGGGISGLSAAHFYRKAASANARILILDNHDDFGGHAKRNEFHRKPRALQHGSSRPDRRIGHRRGIVPQVSRCQAVPLSRLASEDFFRQGNLRRRSSGHQSRLVRRR